VTDRHEDGRATAAAANKQFPAFRLNLEQQRKRAKELQRALRTGEPAALRRFQAHHPHASSHPTSRGIRLSEAQLVIARELGLPSWPRLKSHIGAMERARDSMTGTAAAIDAGMRTLHIRCGSDVKSTLQEGGFTGDFLEYSDPFCRGPVVDTADWLRRRAMFIASYLDGSEPDVEQLAARLEEAEARLRSAPDLYERVVMWFEHDSYDQLILARCLAQFAGRPPRRLELISVDHFPGGMRFIGLGQLPPEALRLLWATRQPVSEQQRSTGLAVWNALRAADPSGLAAIARSGTPDLPQLAGAIRRHCQELPWTRDGLSLTERLVLEMLVDGPHRVGPMFRDLTLERDPLPWLGDLMFRSIVQAMKQVSEPVFTGLVDEPESPVWREQLTITPMGRAVLAGDVDWLSLRPAERWVGGVAIRPGAPCWRWDAVSGGAILR
jgi:hypothetical protein